MFLTENALLDMFGHRGFQTFPIVLAPQQSIGSRVFHYDLTLHVPVVTLVVLRSEVIQ